MTKKEWWCVTTINDTLMIVEYPERGNGGFGPVSVYEDGWLVGLKYRHPWGHLRHGSPLVEMFPDARPCPICEGNPPSEKARTDAVRRALFEAGSDRRPDHAKAWRALAAELAPNVNA